MLVDKTINFMKIKQLIKKYRNEIDDIIMKELCDESFRITDWERILWIENHEPLYRWAMMEVVPLD